MPPEQGRFSVRHWQPVAPQQAQAEAAHQHAQASLCTSVMSISLSGQDPLQRPACPGQLPCMAGRHLLHSSHAARPLQHAHRDTSLTWAPYIRPKVLVQVW